MSEIWVISDTHFGHENIIEYCNRPFKNSLVMNEAIRDNWNSTVKPHDKVYHLGDVYMGYNQKESITHFLKSLYGKKRLILGNHDNGRDKVLFDCFQKITMWRMFPEFGLLLTHVPVHESTLKIFVAEEGYEEGDVGKVQKKFRNIHGHIHQNPSPTENHFNVSVEHINYRPINIEELRIK